MTITASASANEDGMRVTFELDAGDVGLELELELALERLTSEGVGEGVREVDEDVDTRRLYDQECCGTLRRGHD